MKKLLSVLATIFVFLVYSKNSQAQTYCTTGLYNTFGCTDNDYVNSFSTTGGSTNINTSNTGCSCSCVPGYFYYSNQTHTQIAGGTVNFTFQNTLAVYSEGYKIWVDWNHDGTFDTNPTTSTPGSGEEVYASAAVIPGNGTVVSASFTIPTWAIPGTTRLRIRCVYQTTTFGPCTNHVYGEVEDYNFVVIPLSPCTGAPTAGLLGVTSSCPTILTPAGITMAGATHIQWQKKVVCGGTWVDIPNDTGYTKTVTSVAQPTMFREYIKCLTTGLSDTTNVLTFSSIVPCYCNSSMPTSNLNEDITNVSVGNFLNTSTCATTGGPGSIINKYSDYSNILPPIKLNRGSNYPISVEVSSCNSASPNAVLALVDYNQDGVFDTATEKVLLSATISNGPHIETGNFQVPMYAAEGFTKMRVICAAGNSISAPNVIQTCNFTGYTYGETEDYAVVIQYAPTIVGQGINQSNHVGAYCSGQDVVLTGTAPGISTSYHFLWRKSDGTYIYDSTSIHVNNIQAGLPPFGQAGVYKLYIIVTPCSGGAPDTSGAGTVTLSITPTPPMPIVGSNIVFCLGAPFDSIPIYGAGLKWYAQPTGGIPMFVAPIVNTNVTGTATYYVSQNVNGCEGPRKKVSLTVAPKPAPPTVVTPVVYCQGDVPDQLHASGVNILWYPVASGGLGTPMIPTPGTNAQGIFNWYVTQSIAGCESNRVPVTVKVNYIPNALIQIHKPYVCQYDTMYLSYFGNATNTADYLWGLPNGANVIQGSGQGPLVVRFDTAGTRRVTLQVDNGGCKGPSTYLDIEVRPLPLLTLDLQPDACVGDISSLAIAWSSLSIDKYNWNFDGAFQSYGVAPSGPYGLVWNTPGNKIITLIATDNDCDSRPIHDTINIHPLPDAHITDVNAKAICTGDSVLLQANYYPQAIYRWQPEQFFAAEQSHLAYAKVDENNAWIFLTITNEYNCKGRDSIHINSQPCCKVLMPTAFTPNGDNQNDIFRMIKYNGTAATVGAGNVVTGGTVSVSSFEIFNRWGQIVFQTADDRTGWDGTYNGVPQDVGVYSYHIRYKCADGNFYEEKGDVTLIR